MSGTKKHRPSTQDGQSLHFADITGKISSGASTRSAAGESSGTSTGSAAEESSGTSTGSAAEESSGASTGSVAEESSGASTGSAAGESSRASTGSASKHIRSLQLSKYLQHAQTAFKRNCFSDKRIMHYIKRHEGR